MPPRSTPKKSTAKSKAQTPQGKGESKKENSFDFDPDIALPIDFSGRAFTSISNGGYYPFFAPSDTLFQKLLTLRLLSPTQANCINDKTFYSVGAGLQVIDQEFPADFDKKINGKRQLIDDVLKGVFESYWQDGNDFIEVVRTEVAGEKFVHVYKHNNLDCRFAEPEDGDDPTHVIRSKEFRREGLLIFKEDANPITIPIWTDNPLHDDDVWLEDPKKPGTFRTMLVVRNEVQGIDHYGLPSNFAGFIQAYLEYNVARFNLDNFENNMFLAGVLTIMGQVSSTEAKQLLADIRRTYMGRGKQRRIFTASSEGGISDTKFTPFTQTHEGHFVEFDKHNEGKIVSANGWSRELLDMHDKAGLGKGGEYLAQLFKRKFHTTIIPVQQTVLNNFIFPLMKIIDEFKGTSFYDMPWTIKPVIPVGLEGVLDINSLLTVDEGRQEIGKGPIENGTGQMQISQVKGKSSQPAGEGNENNDQNEGGAK
jgi:hypothetical protein